MFNYSLKFNDIINDFKNEKWEDIDEKLAEDFIKSLSFIFDKTKMSNPISYAVFYSMQYVFWQVVVVGGILANMKLSARLLLNALSLFGKEPDDLIIDDEQIINQITESEEFKTKIKPYKVTIRIQKNNHIIE